MALFLGVIQSIPMLFDVVFTASIIFTLLYTLTRLTLRLVPRLGRYEYRIILLCGVLSVPLVFTAAGRCISILLYRSQPWTFEVVVNATMYVLITIWASVASVLGFRLIKGCWRLGRWVKRLPGIDDPVFEQAVKIVAAGRAVTLKKSGPGGVVASWGLWRRAVLVPDGFMDEYDEDDRRLIYLHELSHLRRFDSYMLFLAAALRSVGWFTPVGRRALCRIQEGMEIACDRAVLACDGVMSIRYAELILRAQAAQASLAPGFAGQMKSEVQARIEHIVGVEAGSGRRVRDGIVCAAFTAFLLVIGVTGIKMDREYAAEMAASMREARAVEEQVVTMPDGSSARHSLLFLWRGSFGGYVFGYAERIEDGDDGGAKK